MGGGGGVVGGGVRVDVNEELKVFENSKKNFWVGGSGGGGGGGAGGSVVGGRGRGRVGGSEWM